MGEGEGGMVQENSIETCILSRVKQITSPGWMHESQQSYVEINEVTDKPYKRVNTLSRSSITHGKIQDC